MYDPAGYMDHGLGYDPSYHGITFYLLTWAACIADHPDLDAKLAQMLKLKSFMTLKEPDRDLWLGPTHFATSTVQSAPRDQWATYYRDATGSMRSDHAKYLLWGGRDWPGYQSLGALDEATMRQQIAHGISTHMGLETNTRYASTPKIWEPSDWTFCINYAYDHYAPGFRQTVESLENSASPLCVPPFEREGDFFEIFGDAFLAAKTGGYGAIIHTGRLSWWGSTTQLAGFGGGALSAFWTPATGSVVLGRHAGLNAGLPDTWSTWRLWPTHAISGENGVGAPFSSARQKQPTRELTKTDSSAHVHCSGPLTDSFASPNGALTGVVTYERDFLVQDSGLTVTSSVHSDGTDTVRELYEIIPIFLGDAVLQPGMSATIAFEKDGSWSDASTNVTTNATAVRVERAGGTIYIEFSTPQDVRLSPQVWTTDYQENPRARNILIDLLKSGGTSVPFPAEISIQYTFTTQH